MRIELQDAVALPVRVAPGIADLLEAQAVQGQQDTAPGPQHAPHLAQRLPVVRQVLEDTQAHDRVELPRAQGERVRMGADEAREGRLVVGLGTAQLVPVQVETEHPGAPQGDPVVIGPLSAADIENTLAIARLQPA